MPTGVNCKLKIGENDYALKAMRKTYPKITMDDIKLHNVEANGYDEGYAEAVKKYKEWRNKIYLELKGLYP